MKSIDPTDLLDLAAEARARRVDLRCDLIYAQADHPLNCTFKEAIYRHDARLWLYRDLAEIVLEAAKLCRNVHGLRFVVTDGLRTTDAQRRMMDTAIVKANPHWIADGPKMLLSRPGGGGHPRGMAVDIYLEAMDGTAIDMGTPLDYFSTDPDDNPAARDYKGFPEAVYANRALLETLMTDAAKAQSVKLLPLPSEWWDFRLTPEFYESYAPLSDADLPPHMRLCVAA